MISIVSVVIPLVVAVLFTVRIPNVAPLSYLPPIYATINGITALLLLLALWAIKNGKKRLHQNIMNLNMGLSMLFLIMYIAYHMTSDPTPFGGSGITAYVYYFILITHIVLSILLIPLVLRTYAKAYVKDFKGHRSLARITFPIWFYVAVSGVLVYTMISPYYPH